MVNIKELITLLHYNNVRFIIIGGHAAVLQGSGYLTADIDFCYSRNKANIENIIKALMPFHPKLRGADENVPFVFDTKSIEMGLNFSFSTDLGDIDLFGEVSGIGNYDDVLKYSETVDIYEIPCKVLTLEGLIISKRASGRQKDLILLSELEALLEIRKGQKK
jgi:predicted nucleotidyltransferase